MLPGDATSPAPACPDVYCRHVRKGQVGRLLALGAAQVPRFRDACAVSEASQTHARRVGETPYGYFDEAAREYVITRPDTPTPWFNYIGEGRYGGIVSNTAGGYAFDRDPQQPARSALPLQRDPGRPARPLRLPARHGDGQVLEPDLAADAGAELDELRVPPRRRLHADRERDRAGSRPSCSTSCRRPPARRDCPCELWVLRVRNTSDTAAPAAHLLLRRVQLLRRR